MDKDMMIGRFTGAFEFLSNFYPATVILDGQTFSTVEHAYQAAKTLDPLEREVVRNAPTAGKAKQLGVSVTLRPDWTTETRLRVMGGLLRQKFASDPLRSSLEHTGGAHLVEGNWWHDHFWGECTCPKHIGVVEGLNHLGRLLMDIRAENRSSEK